MAIHADICKNILMHPTSFPLQAGKGFDALDEPWKATTVGFLVEKERRTGSSRTPEVYRRMLGDFLSHVSDPAVATALDVHRFAYGVGASGAAPAASTICVRIAAISGFYDFARRMGIVESNPASQVHRPLGRRALPRGLTPAEVERLLAAIPDTPTGLLDRAIVVTAVLTGLRRSELMSLRLGDVSPDCAAYYEVRTKGGVRRRRALPDPAWHAIRVAAAAMDRNIGVDDPAVFPISDTTFYAHLRRYAETAGLGRVSPHVLRHTAAKLRRMSGATIEQVSSLLGHVSIATTAIYLNQLDDERDDGWGPVAQAVGIASWPSATVHATRGSAMPRTGEQRRSGCANSRSVTWIGGHVHAPLPRSDTSPTQEEDTGTSRATDDRPGRRIRAHRARWIDTDRKLSPLRRSSRAFNGWGAMASPER